MLFLLSAPSFLSCLFVTGEQVALVEVVLRERRTVSTVLQGEVIEASWGNTVLEEQKQTEHVLEGDLRLVKYYRDLKEKTKEQNSLLSAIASHLLNIANDADSIRLMAKATNDFLNSYLSLSN